MGKTDTGAAILTWIRAYVHRHGYPPTVREICGALGLKSTATVHYHLRRLEEQGFIETEPGKKRAIRPVGEGAAAPSAGKEKKEKANSPEILPEEGTIPILGTVAAGQPILAQENIDGWLSWENGEGWFALRVKGWSMKDAGILPGDLLVVRPQPTAEQGEIVVALLGEEATVKRLHRQDGELWLMPENEEYSPIDGRQAVILGVVRGLVRKYESS